MNVYVAASWRTASQPLIVNVLRMAGHSVYDFRADGFSWTQIDNEWKEGGYWTPEQIVQVLETETARRGFLKDFDALVACDVCLLLQPSGRSAHLELGYALGLGKIGIVFLEDGQEPDLMYSLAAHRCTSLSQVLDVLALVRGTYAAPMLPDFPAPPASLAGAFAHKMNRLKGANAACDVRFTNYELRRLETAERKLVQFCQVHGDALVDAITRAERLEE
jgi:hypothetical protein